MAKLLPSLLLVLCLGVGKMEAQVLTLSKDTSHAEQIADGDMFERVAKNRLTNNGAQTLTVTWVRTVETFDADWQSLVCDFITCFPPNVTTNTITLPPGQFSNLDVHFQPDELSGLTYLPGGSASVEIYIYAEEDSANINLTGYFEGVMEPVGIGERAVGQVAALYPNPAKDKLNVTLLPTADAIRLEIYDLQGKKLASHDIPGHRPDFSVDVSGLEGGVYFMALYNAGNNLMETRRFLKANE